MEQNKFFVYSWGIDETETEITAIRIYGINENNMNVCVRVNNFTPYVYIELPEKITWTASNANLVGSKIDEMLKKCRPLKKVFEMKKKLYGAHLDSNGEKKLFPYLCCYFSSRNDIKALLNNLRKPIFISGIGSTKLKVHEQDADPILQLVCNQDIPTAGWIEFFGKTVPDEEKVTICDLEFYVKYERLRKYDDDIIGSPKIMGYDIEVNSSNPSMMPRSSHPGDKVFQISCIFSRYGTSENDYVKYLLSLGDPEPSLVGGEDVIILTYPTESDLLEGFTDLIRTENPNIIAGYNIFGFDIPYMIDRAKHNMCLPKFDKQSFHKYQHSKEKTIKWSSSAYGTQEFLFLDSEGRLFVDLLPLIKRDYKMDNYKLKTISTYFIGQTKEDLSVHGIFKCYRLGVKRDENGQFGRIARKAMGICGRYCLMDSILVLKIMEKIQTWVGLCEMASTTNTQIFSLYTQGQQIKVFSQTYKYCLENNIVVEKDGYIASETERYMGAHVFEPITGVHDRVIPFDFCSLYPTTIIAYNIDYSTIVDNDDPIPNHKCHVMEWSEHLGCSHDPNTIRRLQLTDYITAEKEKIKAVRERKNKSLDKLIKKELTDDIDRMTLELKPYVDERSALMKSKPKIITCEERYYRFLKEPKGVFPTILQNLLDARKRTRSVIKRNVSLIESEKKSENVDDDKIVTLQSINNVLDKRQLAYKISANSVGGPTPVPCLVDGKFRYMTIEELSKGDWVDQENIQVSTPIDNLQIWSDVGYTNVTHVMRHKMEKPLVRVGVHTGFVDCTEDHSLLDEDGVEVKPTDVDIGDKLLTFDLPLPDDAPNVPEHHVILDQDIFNEEMCCNGLSCDSAFMLGMFFAEGSFKRYGFSMSSKMTENIDDDTRKLFYDHRKTKRIPNIIFSSPYLIRKSFFIGYHRGNGSRSDKDQIIITNDYPIGSAGLCYLAKTLGYKVEVSCNKNNHTYVLCCFILSRNNEHNSVKNITQTPSYGQMRTFNHEMVHEEFVYDVETVSHHFAAGVGNLIVHNSMYGAMGVRRGYLPFMPGAMATTYMGRKNIEIVANTIVKDFKGKLVYGDSVTEDTPILCRIDNKIFYRTIDDVSSGDWEYYRGDKEVSSPVENLEVWTETGFTKIKKVIRHRTDKELFRVLVHTGVVDVTEDHGLLDTQGNKVSPKDIDVGFDLMTSNLPEQQCVIDIITPSEAYIWGVFYSSGNFDVYRSSVSGDKYSWSIDSQDVEMLKRCRDRLNTDTALNFQILKMSISVYKLVVYGLGTDMFVERWKNLFHDKRKYKVVPDSILWSSKKVRQAFFYGYCDASGKNIQDECQVFNINGKIGSAGLYYLTTSLGYKVSVDVDTERPDMYEMTCTKAEQMGSNSVKKIYSIGQTDKFVYDLETENHHFSAGVGNLIVHNTDSNYIHFEHLTTVEESWAYAEYVAQEISKMFPPPIKLDYEEVIYWRFFILTKKRYMYKSCGKDGVVSNKVGKKGVLLARRDNSMFVRNIYEQIIMKIFNRDDMDEIFDYILDYLNKLFSNYFPYRDFVVTKAVGDTGGMVVETVIDEKGKKKGQMGQYKVPLLAGKDDPDERQRQLDLKESATEKEYYEHCLPAQVQLAEKMKKRGQLVEVGTRLEYVITEQGGISGKQYTKIESVDYFANHREVLKIDFMYYLKVLTNPVDQILNIINKNSRKYKQNLLLEQYKIRLKKKKMLDELNNLFTPKVIFIE